MTGTHGEHEERIYLATHKHWAAFVEEHGLVLAACAGGLFMLFAYSRFSTAFVSASLHALLVLLFPAALLLFWILSMSVWTKFYLETVILTDERLLYVAQPTLLRRTVAQWNIHQVRYASAQRVSFLGTMFGFGTISVGTDAGEPATVIDGIPQPEEVCTMILREDHRLDELTETAQQQRELLHFISHEVKGHLTKSKAAFASIIEGDYGPISEPLGSLAHQAYEDAEKGVRTVMNILDTTDLSHGTMQFALKPFDYAAMVKRAVEEFQPQAAAKGLDIVAHIEPCTIIGDEAKIERHVVRNLIDNAIRYTPHGRISVTLSTAAPYARFSVTDTGVGIAESDKPKLFTEGGHGEHSRDINRDSTGFGLFVAKKVVDGLGGRIWAESEGAGKGSTFIAELPLSRN